MTTVEPLPDYLTMYGSDAGIVTDAYKRVIERAIAAHPRSLQRRIGPSEVGTRCDRRLGYKVLDVDEGPRPAAWRPAVGTAVHAQLEEWFGGDNAREGEPIWLIEQRVSVGEVLGEEITGSADLFDQVTGTVIDHKIVGPSSLKKYKASGPSHQYRVQAHLYGRGFARAGLRVERVMIAFLPMAGELTDAYYWSEPYDEQIALDALSRLEGIARTAGVLGPAALAVLDTADDCHFCPFYTPFVAPPGDLEAGCPGASTRKPAQSAAPAVTQMSAEQLLSR